MDGKPNDNEFAKSPHDEGNITQLLDQARSGSSEAREYLLKEVYNELRIIAASQMRHERNDHTLGATALVNESYLKLIRSLGGESVGDSDQTEESFSFSHRHAFYKAAATAMRRILIDHARAKAAGKRSAEGNRRRISIDLIEASTLDNPHDLLSLDDALSRLESEDERAACVVRLRFFAGRQIDEIAEMLEVSSRTVKRDWEFARARLQQLIEAKGEAQDGADE